MTFQLFQNTVQNCLVCGVLNTNVARLKYSKGCTRGSEYIQRALIPLDRLRHKLYEPLPVLLGVTGGYAVHVASVLHSFCCFRGL